MALIPDFRDVGPILGLLRRDEAICVKAGWGHTENRALADAPFRDTKIQNPTQKCSGKGDDRVARQNK